MTPDFRSLRGEGRFIFLRHGESVGNNDGIIQGRHPSSLTPRGREQAARAGVWLRKRPPVLVLSSPLGRARETADIVAAAAGLPAVTDLDDLTEIDTGLFTGLTIAQARERHTETYRDFQQASWDAVPGAETSDVLYDRAHRVWEHLLLHFRAGRTSILCVTHSGFLQWIVRATLGWKSWMPLFSASGNCHITELAIRNRDLGEGRHAHYVEWVRVNSAPTDDPEVP